MSATVKSSVIGGELYEELSGDPLVIDVVATVRENGDVSVIVSLVDHFDLPLGDEAQEEVILRNENVEEPPAVTIRYHGTLRTVQNPIVDGDNQNLVGFEVEAGHVKAFKLSKIEAV